MNQQNNTYTFLYIVVATIISTITLFYFAKVIPELIPKDNLIKEILMCSGQIVWQGIIFKLFLKKNSTQYLYNMITVSLLGSLILIPLIIANHFFTIRLELRILFFLLVVIFMIIEHTRRVKKLELPSYLTVTWIVYRILWLPILLF